MVPTFDSLQQASTLSTGPLARWLFQPFGPVRATCIKYSSGLLGPQIVCSGHTQIRTTDAEQICHPSVKLDLQQLRVKCCTAASAINIYNRVKA